MPEKEIVLSTRDGAQIAFACGESQTVLAAAESAGYYLPALCHEGSCGLCRARVMSGRYELGQCSEAALPNPGGGAVLLCRCVPEESLAIEVPYQEAQILRQKMPVREAEIVGLAPAWAGAMALTLQLEANAEFGQAAEFSPGQYMELTIPGTEIRRAYSLTNLPNWEGRLEFLVRIQPNGLFSRWLSQQAKVGDKVTVRGPAGQFVLDEGSVRPRCLVGGGCGMAPILSMLRHMAEFQDSQPVHLIFGANKESELMPPEEVAALRAKVPQLGITLAVWHPEPGWSGFTGTTAAALAKFLEESGEEPDIYVCGPPKMLEAVESVARERGLGDRIIAERL